MDLLQCFPSAMLIGPAVDVRPVKVLVLDGNDVANVIAVLPPEPTVKAISSMFTSPLQLPAQAQSLRQNFLHALLVRLWELLSNPGSRDFAGILE